MNENQAKQLTWDLMLAAKRLDEDCDTIETDGVRHQFFVDLHGEALKRFGHDGFNA